MQRREMRGGAKLVQHLRRNELVGKKFRSSVHDAMAHCSRGVVHMILNCFSHGGEGGALRLEYAFTRDQSVSIGRTNVQLTVAAPNVFRTSFQQRSFVVLVCTTVVEAKLKRRRAAVEYEDQVFPGQLLPHA